MLESSSRQPPGARHRDRHRQGPVRRERRRVPSPAGPGAGCPSARPARTRNGPATSRTGCGRARRGDHLDAEAPAQAWNATAAASLPGCGPASSERLLALNTTIWHNWAIGAPVKRSLIAYDHLINTAHVSRSERSRTSAADSRDVPTGLRCPKDRWLLRSRAPLDALVPSLPTEDGHTGGEPT